MVKKKDTTEERIVAVEEALSKTEQFIEKNQKILTIIVAALVVVVLVVIGFRKFYVQPKEKNAAAAMFMAERYFEKDSFNLALNGDGFYMGFLDVIDDYGITKSANLARYYSGISYLRLGDYENAIKYLKKFKSDDQIVSGMALGAIGDAYLGLKEVKKGAGYYVRAAEKNDNNFVTPSFLFKAAMAYELMNDWSNALALYEKIQKNYPKSPEARDLDKYIARAKNRMGKS
ncbi:MAG: tetratricopeptide repeat protein [Bacteroidales bacterium]|nr:tetratricopeptide repeat protein [Bacteroidales bacterium]